jgi:glycosyltransferase involved in cell wall biosynthesis
MKIIFSLNHFLPGSLAGIEVYTYNLAHHLQQLGVDVLVLIPNFDCEGAKEYFYKGIKVIQYAENSPSSREMILGTIKPDGLALYAAILEKEKPDIVHFQELSAGRGIGNYHLREAAAMGIKILLTCHLSTYSCQTGNLIYKQQEPCDGIIRTGKCTACAYEARSITGTKSVVLQTVAKLLYTTGIDTSKLNSSLGTALGFPCVVDRKKQVLAELSRLCDAIISLTRWYQQMLSDNGVPANKIQYLPQGLKELAIRTEHKLASIPVKLVFVGRVSKYKGVHLLIEALQQLPPDKVSLNIYGPVTEDEYADRCRRNSKNMRNVYWMGSIPSEEVVTMLGDYDLLCLPSTFSEMSPLVIQEAFAAGIPVLASNVYGNAEQVQDGVNGWLFDFKSVASLKEKLIMLINKPAMIDVAGKQTVAAKTFAELSAEHLQLYQQIVSGTTIKQPVVENK